uniref:Uncharacterized protein n=1 Tax=Meloidogyne hapla TaxID=6305 RepID=A0A1I8BMI5_MELHA
MLIKLFGCKRKEESINSGQEEDEETISLNPWFYEDEELENDYEAKQISPFTLAAIVFTYLAVGAVLLPLLQGCFQFIDGLFYSYLCFTAIEYGHLIPEKVTVKDLISAVGQAIGMSPESMEKVDMNRMVGDAIAVKEGQLGRVGQNYMFLEGIWPPELIPLFQRDGDFPSWVDADELKRLSLRTPTSNGIGLIQKREELAPILSLSTYSNGQLHRSLHSTSSNSYSSKEKKNKKKGEKKRETASYSKDKNNNNGNNNCTKDMDNIPFI